MNIKTRAAMVRDLTSAVSIDLKTQEYPLDLKMLSEFVEDVDKEILMASIGNRDVGIVTLRKDIPASAWVMNRLSVHPAFQNMGVGRKLLSEVSNKAYKDRSRAIRFLIPSYRIDDLDDPEYLGDWLYGNEFKAVKCLDRVFYRYGSYWDGYIFEALV